MSELTNSKKKSGLKGFPVIFYFLAVLTIGWFVLITYLSHQNDISSNDNSLKLTTGIIVMAETIEGNREKKLEENLTYSGTFNLILREIAHLGAFGGLSFFLLMTLFSGKLKLWPGIVFSLLWSIIDELSKLLFPGRHTQLRDLMLNIFGAIIGILFGFILIVLIKRRRRSYGDKGHS